jgi:hypothetical protein
MGKYDQRVCHLLMTENTDNSQSGQKSRFTFNFDQAVEAAKRDFPKETENVTFIDTSAPEAADQLLAWAKKARFSQTQYEALIQKMHDQSAFASVSSSTGDKLLGVPVNRDPEKWGFKNEKDKSAFFVFNHELGHIVIPEALASDSSKTTEYREHAADTFAVLRSMQQGVLDKKDIVAKADDRGHSMLLTGDLTHLTSMSLDAVAINPKNTDFLSLSPKEMVKIAQKHAGTFETDHKTESAFLKVRRAGMDAQMKGDMDTAVEERLHGLSYICLTAKPDSMQFYMAARILNNALESGEISYQGKKVKVDRDNEHWQHIKETIREKAGTRDIGAKKALETADITRKTEEKQGFVSRIKSAVQPIKI